MSIRTKEMIAGAFLELARKKDIDKITVKDLVEKCNISRQSFYYHFQDIFSVIEWITEQLTEKILEESLQAKSPQDAIANFLAVISENPEIFRRMLNSQKRDFVEKLLVDNLQIYLRELLCLKASDMTVKLSDAQIALEFYSYGIAGILLEHCGDKEMDIEKLSDQICRLMLNGRKPA